MEDGAVELLEEESEQSLLLLMIVELTMFGFLVLVSSFYGKNPRVDSYDLDGSHMQGMDPGPTWLTTVAIAGQLGLHLHTPRKSLSGSCTSTPTNCDGLTTCSLPILDQLGH